MLVSSVKIRQLISVTSWKNAVK